jgi:hypothetical protein
MKRTRKTTTSLTKGLACAALTATAIALASATYGQTHTAPLTGTWTLVAADLLLPDGRRTHDYGTAPKGLLMIDGDGHYSLQIYDSARPKFASGKKDKGTPAEYEAAIMGNSVHFGMISIDAKAATMTLTMQGSTYPNQEGSVQKRVYELKDDMLSYRVAPRPDGSIPISEWRRLK